MAEIIHVDFKNREYWPDEETITIDDILSNSLGCYAAGIFIGITYDDEDNEMVAFMTDFCTDHKKEKDEVIRLLKTALRLLK